MRIANWISLIKVKESEDPKEIFEINWSGDAVIQLKV